MWTESSMGLEKSAVPQVRLLGQSLGGQLALLVVTSSQMIQLVPGTGYPPCQAHPVGKGEGKGVSPSYAELDGSIDGWPWTGQLLDGSWHHYSNICSIFIYRRG